MKKLPKSMGACADLLYDTREQRLALAKQVEELATEEQRIKDHIINNLRKDDNTGGAGKHHRVQVVPKWKPRVDPTKWDKFYAWVAKNKRFDLLQKRLNDAAGKELIEAGKKVPGLERFKYVDVSLTKV